MRTLALSIFISSCLFSSIVTYDYKTGCSCGTWKQIYPDSGVQLAHSAKLAVSEKEEYINGVSYGKLIDFANKVWLSQDVKAYPSTGPIRTDCPVGFRVPTPSELSSVIEFAKKENPDNYTQLLSDPSKFNLNFSANYVTSNKTFPEITGGGDNKAWEYSILYSKSGNLTIESLSTYWSGNKLTARCVLDEQGPSGFIVSGLTSREFYLNLEYSLKIVKNNTVATYWEINGAKSGTEMGLKWTPNKAGCNVITAYAALFGGVPLRNCMILWADYYVGSEGDTTLKVADIKTKNYTDLKVALFNSMHFSSSSAPIAPKKDGGAYILTTTKDNNTLYVRTVDNNGDEGGKQPTTLFRNGKPLDITATPWGYVSLIVDAADSNKLYLLGSYADGKQKFEVILMNNGKSPTSAGADQIKAYSSDGTLVFGFNAMYNPHNGRLLFVRDRIQCIFAHYNHFGMKDGSRDDHTGDTFVSFNETGGDFRLGWSWGASHSLIQSMISTGSRVVTAALGDAYPEQIKFNVVDLKANPEIDKITGQYNRVNQIGKSDIISGAIPGNHAGQSCGNLGGLSLMNSNTIIGVYTRKACTTTTTNTKNEVGVIIFDQSLKKIDEVVLADGSKVHVVKSAKYGKNLVVAYGTTTFTGDYPPRNINSANDKMFLMLIDSTGKVLAKDAEVKPLSLTPNDDFRVLNDGSVAWTYINADGYLSFNTLPAPPSTALKLDETSLIDSTQYSSDIVISDTPNNNSGGGNSGEVLKNLFSKCLLLIIFFFAVL